jgi:AhpD family alkylhydroperoxidase
MGLVVQVFDPAMCCSTGVCGPSVDEVLVRFASDLDWLKGQGIEIKRFNLSQQPDAFAQHPTVMKTLSDYGVECLPLVFVGDEIKAQGEYPSRSDLASWVGISVAPSIFSDAVAELVAIGAAIASNCEPCFLYHYDKAQELGVSKEDMLAAVRVAQTVKEAPATSILDLATRYLDEKQDAPKKDIDEKACCESAAQPLKLKSKSCCC